jgi:hypothetical protein
MKMIRVDDDTHDRLKTHGRFGESFQDIINRLMNRVEGKKGSIIFNEKERRMYGERFVCALYSLADGTRDEKNADTVYAELKLGAISNERMPTGEMGHTVAANDLIYHLIHERYPPQIEQNGRNIRLTEDGLQYCIEECRWTLHSLNMRIPANTKYKERP